MGFVRDVVDNLWYVVLNAVNAVWKGSKGTRGSETISISSFLQKGIIN